MGKILFTKSKRFRDKPYVKFCVQEKDTHIAIFRKNFTQNQYCDLKKCRGFHVGCARCAKNQRHAGQCSPLTGYKTYTKKQKMEKLQSLIEEVKMSHDIDTIKKMQEESKIYSVYTELLKSENIDITNGLGGKQEVFSNKDSTNLESSATPDSTLDSKLVCLDKDKFLDWHKPTTTEPLVPNFVNMKCDLSNKSATSSGFKVNPFKAHVTPPCFFKVVARDIINDSKNLWDEVIGLTKPLSPISGPSVYDLE